MQLLPQRTTSLDPIHGRRAGNPRYHDPAQRFRHRLYNRIMPPTEIGRDPAPLRWRVIDQGTLDL